MRRALALFAFTASLLVSAWIPELLAAKVTLNPKFVYYEVTGSSVAELRASIALNGPKQGTIPRDSKTETEFFYDTKFSEVGSVCRFSNVRIRVVTVYTLPKWINRDKAPADLKARWDAYAQSLRQHQDGHAAIDARKGRRLGEAIEKYRLKGGCKGASAAIGALMKRITGDESEHDALNAKTTVKAL